MSISAFYHDYFYIYIDRCPGRAFSFALFLREQHEENNKKLRKQHANTRQKQLKKKNYIAIILNNKNLNYCFYQIFLIEILINILKNILIIQFKFQITIHIKLRYILICIYYMI